MVEAFEWCLELGVEHISVYAFSIDNFKRSCGEVGDLMHLAERKYSELLQVRGPPWRGMPRGCNQARPVRGARRRRCAARSTCRPIPRARAAPVLTACRGGHAAPLLHAAVVI